MQHKALLVVELGLLALAGYTGTCQADGRKTARAAAPATGEQRAVNYRKRATRVRGYYSMRGGYAYDSSVIPAPYERYRGPYGVIDQSPGGPFDSGFFFDSGIAPLNNAPY